MGETTAQIERHIEIKRAELEDNFAQLASKIRAATDVRGYVRRHAPTVLAVSFGSGMLLAVLLARVAWPAPPRRRARWSRR